MVGYQGQNGCPEYADLRTSPAWGVLCWFGRGSRQVTTARCDAVTDQGAGREPAAGDDKV